MEVIELSSQTYSRLAALAIPFIDKSPEDVIKRLIDISEGNHPMPENGTPMDSGTPFKVEGKSALKPSQTGLNLRLPRERGAVVSLGGQIIHAATVPDLYEQSLKFIFDQQLADKVRSLLPYPTSKQRYLIATKPIHPNGKDFVITVQYNGLYMEVHKSYSTAVNHLAQLMARVGVEVRYISS